MKYSRIFLLVLDSLGIGAMDDAAAYGDAGANTLGHIAHRAERLSIPSLLRMGISGFPPRKSLSVSPCG